MSCGNPYKSTRKDQLPAGPARRWPAFGVSGITLTDPVRLVNAINDISASYIRKERMMANNTKIKSTIHQSAFKFIPSDLTFLREECPRCFYKKVALGQPRPSTPFPKIFSRLDKLQKQFFAGLTTHQVCDGLPSGVFHYSDHWVESRKFRVPGHDTPFFIRGRFDVVAIFDDGSYGLIDYKTSSPKDDYLRLYSRQLHSYALALEYPAPGQLSLSPISTMGLLCLDPVEMVSMGSGSAMRLETHWVEFPRDNLAFKDFLSETLTLLEAPAAPPPNVGCAFCRYQESGIIA